MGKPFARELDQIEETVQWAEHTAIEVDQDFLTGFLSRPLLSIGSGGSLSACYYSALLHQQYGFLAKAITPLEVFNNRFAIKTSSMLFISAGGRNGDILFGLETAVRQEAVSLLSICMTLNSPLAGLTRKTSSSAALEFSLPVGKDGFLATNSLVAFFVLLNRLYQGQERKDTVALNRLKFQRTLDDFIKLVTPGHVYTVLAAGWGMPVAIDIESKFSEAALGAVLVSDYRNFGHGRHHWFAKRPDSSAVIAIVTPEEKDLAYKTLALLPADIPRLLIETAYEGSYSSIDLLQQSFYLTAAVGTMQHIDPGRPGVPEFGSKLYNLKYKNLFKKKLKSTIMETAIKRKQQAAKLQLVNSDDQNYWREAFLSFYRQLQEGRFGAVIFDYDGTLCSAKDRFSGIDSKVAAALIQILEQGFVIGIVTGRGKSVRIDMQRKVPDHLWQQVAIGYYNGGAIGLLSDDKCPNLDTKFSNAILAAEKQIRSISFPCEIEIESRFCQITITVREKKYWPGVRSELMHELMQNGPDEIGLVESSHSIDVIDKTIVSKGHIIPFCRQLCKGRELPTDVVAIGDRGLWPGNDYSLLSEKYSLSVDEVSVSPKSCWNISQPGSRNVEATLEYLAHLKKDRNALIFDVE